MGEEGYDRSEDEGVCIRQLYNAFREGGREERFFCGKTCLCAGSPDGRMLTIGGV